MRGTIKLPLIYSMVFNYLFIINVCELKSCSLNFSLLESIEVHVVTTTVNSQSSNHRERIKLYVYKLL